MGAPTTARCWGPLPAQPTGALRCTMLVREPVNKSEAEVIVHRKGATPAGAGVLGIIPGSMGTPGYVVRGKGVAASLNSAAHGAGRRMSRTKAKELFSWNAVRPFLHERGVTLLSAGLDEVPMAYRDI